ncbi:MAG: amidohydrolase family protein, partial [Microbacterium sp.]
VELAHKTTRGPAILDAAGVRIAISTDHPVLPIQHLIVQTIVAVRDGLDRTRALEAITLTPARLLGVDDRIGSLVPGKLADLVAWTGDPLDVYQRPDAVWITGALAWSRAGGHARPSGRMQ